MHDFGDLVYLDLQKTGSTFVSEFLNRTCILPLVRESKHGRINERKNPNAFYFITVRHPVAQYSSLFRYGLDRRGALYARMSQLGMAGLYELGAEAFNKWLRFVLEFENAELLGEGFERIPKDYNIGFLSYRYLMLSLARPERTIRKKPSNVDIADYAKECSIVNHVIKNEELNEGLMELSLSIKPEYFDKERVEEFLKKERKKNASSVSAEQISQIDKDLYRMVVEKERILFEFYS